MMIHRIVITGMRGCGKSHYSKRIAQYLGWSSVDLDREIEKKAKRKISEIVEQEGWDYFRKMETEECKNLVSHDHTVVSTGGGAIFTPENIPFLKQNAIIIFLNVGIGELKARLREDTERPGLLTGISREEEMSRIWEQRKESYFRLADFVFYATKYEENTELDIQRKIKAIAQTLQLYFLQKQ
jgi:shikimate kinase